MPRPAPFTREELTRAIAASQNWSEVLRRLRRPFRGHNHRTVQRWARRWHISTEHFDPYARIRRGVRTRSIPLEDVLVENSTYSRGTLKKRLYREGLKQPVCEMCGIDEMWHGQRMSLILDHINGVSNDNRLENLRIVCPNCAATLPTHCGRNPVLKDSRSCVSCGEDFVPRYTQHRYCSLACAGRANGQKKAGVPQPHLRRVERPPYEQLMRELEETSYLAVGRKYGVSDNAVREWVRFYEAELRPSPPPP